jgi:hypothetical protein
MAAHYHVEIEADLAAFNPRDAVIANRFIHPDIDPTGLDSCFSVYDEDGEPLLVGLYLERAYG